MNKEVPSMPPVEYFAFSPWRRELIKKNPEGNEGSHQEIPQIHYNAGLHENVEEAVKEMQEYIAQKQSDLHEVELRFTNRASTPVSTPSEDQVSKFREHVEGISIDMNIVTLYPGDTYTRWGEWAGNEPKVHTVKPVK